MSPSASVPTPAKFPQANVLTEGFATAIPRVPENAALVKERERDFFNTLCPRNYFQAWVSDDVALMTIRLERCARIEKRERDRISLRAESFWDDDRSLEAEELGARLAGNPSRVAARLKRTPHGCDWMIGRWSFLLAEIARDANAKWTEGQTALAFDLLGTPHEFRSVPPAEPAELARREIAALRDRRLALEPADTLDRALAMADMTEQSTPELRLLRRYENALHKRLRWAMHQLQVEPKHHHPNPNLAYLYEPEPEPEPAPEPESQPIVAPEATPPPDPKPQARTRPEPKAIIVKEPAPEWLPTPIMMNVEHLDKPKSRRAVRRDE